MSEWISVKDRLPEFGQAVLIYTEYGKYDVCDIARDSDGDIMWHNFIRPRHTNGSVTHWQPLPKPPKE